MLSAKRILDLNNDKVNLFFYWYMARILGVDIPDNKRGEIALTHIYGIGRNLSKKILTETKVGNKKVIEWSDDDFNKVRIEPTLVNDLYKYLGAE